MSMEFSELEAQVRNSGTSYVFKDHSAFPYDEWVPTLLNIYLAKNIGQQKEAFGGAIARVGAYHRGLRAISDKRLEYYSGVLLARFRMLPEQQPRPSLTYLAIGRVARVGYQTPDEITPNPAFAVVDIPRAGYHRIVRDPGEVLSDAEADISTEVVQALAQHLNHIYPGFEIYQKLEAELT